MAANSFSPFLQALGWAALNSIWQTGLLWCLFIIANSLFILSPKKRYLLSVTGIGIGFTLFWINILYFLIYGAELQQNFSSFEIPSLNGWLPAILTSASLTYLLLLSIPIYKLYNNWRFLRLLQKQPMQKTCIDYKLFVQKMSAILGIKKNVSLYFSAFINSPVTIGFIKPMILLPIASLNSLTISQAEAVLLHELSHIRRYDYLVNIFINIINTLLYFNPFIKLFERMAENSREECCDQVVLQFGYDKINYANALLNLEKASVQNKTLAIGAIGKSNFVHRLEKIVGISSKKETFKFSHIAGFFAALIFVFFMHSFFTAIQKNQGGHQFAYNNFANPFYFLVTADDIRENRVIKPELSRTTNVQVHKKEECIEKEVDISSATNLPIEKSSNYILPVALNEVETHLTKEQKNKVESTIRTAKKVLMTYEWNQLQANIPDGLTPKEKDIAHKEYLTEVNKINWNNLEKSLKADYENVNWNVIELNLETVLKKEQLDSLKRNYQIIIKQIEKVESNDNVLVLPLPDESIHIMSQLKNELCNKLDTLKSADKKVIKL